jgi:hypothetical protein
MSFEEEGKAYISYKVSKCEGTMLLFIKGNKILLQTYEHKMKVNQGMGEILLVQSLDCL